MRKELLRTLCVSALVMGGSTFIGAGSAVAQSSELTPIIINPEDVYELDAKKPGNIYSSTYQKRVDKLEHENQNLHKIIKTIKQDMDGEVALDNKSNEDVVKLKSDLYDLQKNNDELSSTLDVATRKIEVLQKLVDKQQLNEKYLSHQLKNIDEKIDDRAKEKIKELKSQNESLRVTIKELNEVTKGQDELLAGKDKMVESYGEQEKRIQDLTASNEESQEQIEELQEMVASLTKDNTGLVEEIAALKAEAEEGKTAEVLAAVETSSGKKEKDVFFKKEVIPAEDLSEPSKKKDNKKKSNDTELSSLDLLSTDIDSKKIKYMRGDKEMISGTSDEVHMEETTVVETNYPPLEETLPRQSSFND